MKKLVFLIISVIILITGCSNKNITQENSVKITSSKLFEGDTKKLEAHMDFISSCVKVNYKGNKESIGIKYEIWKNGKKESSENLTSTSFSDGKFNGDISISVKGIGEENKIGITAVIDYKGNLIKAKNTVERFDKNLAYSYGQMQEGITKKDSEETVIWAVIANKSSFIDLPELYDQAKKAEWALVFKVYFK